MFFLQMFSSCFLLSDIKHVFNVFYSHIDVFYNYACNVPRYTSQVWVTLGG